MQSTRYTWKRFGLCLGASALFAVMGVCVRIAEDNQVGYTNDTSLWIFAISGLFAYYALIICIVRWWMKRMGRKPKRPGYWD